jgi:SNF2 family DNA or RNA helicase
MGLGKTVIALTAIQQMLAAGGVRGVLVLGPIRVVETVWRQEAEQWEHLTGRLRFSLVRGTPQQRLAALAAPADIYLTSFSLVKWLFSTLRGVYPFDMLVVDESSAFKAPGAQRFRVMKYAIKRFTRRVIMTGTPSPNSLLELWPQFYLLDEGERLGTSFGRFKARFFVPIDFNQYTWVPRTGARERIQDLINPISVRLDRADYLDLPPVTYNTVKVSLPEEAMTLYRDFERKMFLKLDETTELEAVNAAVLTGKCLQLANGAVYTSPDPDRPEMKTAVHVHDAKLEALEEIVDETGSPVMVAYQYEHDLARLQQWRVAPHLGGKQTRPTSELVSAWNAGELPLLYVHPASAAHGINMQSGPGHTLVFFSQTWSAEQRTQLIARLDRSGQTAPVVVHDIIAERTVDELAHSVVKRKLRTQSALLDALSLYRYEQELLWS